jgi:hypothetical protein
MVAKVDEQQIAVIALAVDPAGDADVLTNVLRAKRIVLVRAVLVAVNCHVILNGSWGPTPTR